MTVRSKIEERKMSQQGHEISCRTSKMDHTLEELEDKGIEFLHMDSVDLKKQESKKEEGEANIEDLDLVSNGSDVMPLPEKPIGSLVNK